MNNGMIKLSGFQRTAPVYFAQQLESTNSSLKRMAQESAEDGTVLIAAEQTGGRGRKGRSFESPNNGLYISFLLKPGCSNKQTLSLTPLAAVAVCRAIETVTGLRPGIKWPNDLLLGKKKICGILTEATVSRSGSLSVILGIGLNVNTAEETFSPELRSFVGSLLTEGGKSVDMTALTIELIKQMDQAYLEWTEDEAFFLEEYRQKCINCGRDVLIIGEQSSAPAKVLGVNDDFSLKICYENGEIEDINFGEVSVRGLY